jgi:hypothetical protein
MCFLFLLLFCIIKINIYFSLIYIYLFGCKFEVWRKKTHLILFQVGFFFNIYKFYFFLFFTLYLVLYIHPPTIHSDLNNLNTFTKETGSPHVKLVLIR